MHWDLLLSLFFLSLHILSMLLFQAHVLENILMGPKPQNHFFHVYYAALIEEKHPYLLFSCTNSLIPFPLRARLNIFQNPIHSGKGFLKPLGFTSSNQESKREHLYAESQVKRGTSCLWMAAAQAGTVVGIAQHPASSLQFSVWGFPAWEELPQAASPPRPIRLAAQ